MSQEDLSKRLQLEEMLHRTSEEGSRLTSLNGNSQDAAKPDATPETAIPKPSRAQRDPAYARQREEALRATGEILHQRCITKLERLEKVRRTWNVPKSVKSRSFIDKDHVLTWFFFGFPILAHS